METITQLSQKYKKVCFLNPMYRAIPTHFHQSMLGLVSGLYQNGFQVAGLMTDASLIPTCRNSLVQAAHDLYVDDPPDMYLWVDSDQVFQFKNFVTLLYHFDFSDEVDVLSARYFTKNTDDPQVVAYVKKDGGYKSISPNLDNVQEVDAVGLGFCLVRPRAMEALWAKYGKRQFMCTFQGDEVLGEDFYWCDLVREAGYRIFVDNTVSIGHYGVVLDERFLVRLKK